MKNFRVEIFISIAVFFVLAIPILVYAHPGNTDSSGCHTCRTNCLDWGLSYGEYHCHASKGLPQPEDPIRSHYGDYGTGYTEPWPDYSYPSYSAPSYPSTPSCPLFSSYDSLSGSCKCNYGYVVDGSSCTSGNTVCHRKYGYNSSYSGLSNSCECDYGYVLNSSNQCVSRDDLCQDMLGYNSEYKILNDTCGCRSGYVLNSSQTSCIDGDNYCQDKYGYNAEYNSFSKSCECGSGYELRNGQCQTKQVSAPIYNPQILKKQPQPFGAIAAPVSANNNLKNDIIRDPTLCGHTPWIWEPECKNQQQAVPSPIKPVAKPAQNKGNTQVQAPSPTSPKNAPEKVNNKKSIENKNLTASVNPQAENAEQPKYSPTREFMKKIKGLFSKWFK